jgi:PmbA protein
LKNYEKFTGGKIKNIIEDLSKFYKEAEVFYKMGRSKIVFFDRGTGFENSLCEEKGIAIRFWNDSGSEYFYHSSGDDSGNLNKVLPEKLKSFSYSKKGNYSFHLADRQLSAPNLNIFCKETAEASSDRLCDFLSDTIHYLEEKWKGVIRVNGAELRAGLSENWLSNSRGFWGSFQRTMASVSLNFEVISKFQEKKTSFSNKFQNFYITFADSSVLNIDPSKILKGFENIPGERIEICSHNLEEKDFKVVFSPQASSELLRTLFEFFQETQDFPFVFSEKLTIVDDAKLEGGLGSAPFDGAGFPSRKTVIIQNGRLIHWLENIIRPSYRDPPRIGPTNLFIERGEKTQEEIIDHVARGAFIVSLRAFNNPNTESKALFLGHGFLIEGGVLSSFAGKFIITTKIDLIFRNILEIGDDIQFIPWSGSYGSPTLLTQKVRLIPFV